MSCPLGNRIPMWGLAELAPNGFMSQSRHYDGLTVVRNSANIKGVPPIEVVFFEEDDGTVPLLGWLDKLPAKARDKCLARLVRLEQLGHDLRRPEADYLEGGIYELRATYRGVHYRMLYFFFPVEPVSWCPTAS